MRTSCIPPVAAWAVAALAVSAAPAAAQLRLTTILERGDPIEGLTFGSTFNAPFQTVRIAPGGEALLNALVQGQSGARGYAVVRADTSGATAIVQGGTAAPGTPPGVGFAGSGSSPFSQIQPRAGGAVFFGGRLGGPGVDATNNTGYWLTSGGQTSLVLRTGTQAPGQGPGVAFVNFNGAAMADSQELVVSATLAGPGITPENSRTLYAGPVGSPQLLAREGDQAPGLPTGRLYSILLGHPSIGATGEVAFSARTFDGVSTGYGVWAGRAGALTLVAQSGQAAPGFEPGSVFNSVAIPTINNAGQVAFIGTVTGATSSQGLFIGEPGGLRPLVRRGQQVPGMGEGNTFRTIFGGPPFGEDPCQFNAQGQALFFATMEGPAFGAFGGFGLARTDGEQTLLIARTGGEAPGLPEGTTFNDFQGASMNALGQIAFLGRTGNSDYDLWAFDGLETRRLLARGDQVLVEERGLLTVADFVVGVGGNPASFSGTALNDDGTLALTIGFTDGTAGIYTLQVPAPAGAAWLVLAGIASAARRRRHA